MLHITNGSVVAGLLRTLGLKGDIVTFHDVLHEGPVQAGLDVSTLRASRAAFVAPWAGVPREQVVQEFATRDEAVLGAAAHEEVVLWFEHDLFDQLQLLQVLDMLPNGGRPRITAVQPDGYLGKHSPAHLATLFTRRREVDAAQRGAARAAWSAFRSSDPRAVLDVIPRVGALPHLPAALLRHLQQFPSVANGLSRTEAQALTAIANGASRMADIYVQSHQEREEAVFMGDAGFLVHMRGVFESATPLLIVVRRQTPAGPLSLEDSVALTDDGLRVLEGHADRVRVCGIDRWLGGVHLSGKGPIWRWDESARRIRLA
jgi:hypothetical protein